MSITVLLPENPYSGPLRAMLEPMLPEGSVIRRPEDGMENLENRRLLFAVALDPSGCSLAYYGMLQALRGCDTLLRGSVAGVIVTGVGEFYTKDVARDMVFAANQAGCAFLGRPLVEATGSLRNFRTQAQIGGVDDTKRYTKCEANGANSEVQINEKLLTAGDQHAVSEMDVILNGAGARTRVVSRSVAKEQSTQVFYPRVQGNAPCFGHVSCDSIIMGAAKVRSIPEISCNHVDATLMHEAAIGKIAGEQLLKLETLGLTPEEAEEKILEGFLR